MRDSRQETEWAGNEDEVEFGLSNYLGYPVHAPDGTPYGTVCVLDSRPRDYSAEERPCWKNCGARSRRCWRKPSHDLRSIGYRGAQPHRLRPPDEDLPCTPAAYPPLAARPRLPAFARRLAADTPAAELLRQAEAERPAYLDTLRQLVAVDSGTGQAEGLGQLSALLAERLQALGAQVRSAPATPPAGANLVATLDGTGSKRFLLMIHYDTVFAAGSAAKRPFREDAERAYGPGVADAKGGVAMVLHALALLRQQGFRDYGRITVLFNPDEETGSAGSKQLIAELARQQDYVFSYEPPDRDAVTVATNGIDGLLLEVKGRSSHAGSAPEQGRNAILELSHQLLRLRTSAIRRKAPR